MDFQTLFQFNLPNEALDLKDFVEGFKDKANGKEKDRTKILSDARQKLWQVQHLVPESENGEKISAKMMIVD